MRIYLLPLAALVVCPVATPQPPTPATASFKTISDWGTGFTGQIIIQNPSASALRNWVLELDWERSLDTIWDAQVVSRQEKHYKIRSAGWNSEIPAGGTVQFGFNASPGGDIRGPENMVVRFEEAEATAPPSPGSIQVRLVQTAAYVGGFSGNVEIKNNDTKPFAGWSLSFRLDRRITAVYGANWTSADSLYTLSATGSGPVIPAGGSLTLALTGNDSLASATAAECRFNGIECALEVRLGPTPLGPANPITIPDLDIASQAIQATVPLGDSTFRLKLQADSAPVFEAVISRPSIATVSVEGERLLVRARSAGRASIRIAEKGSKAVRYLGLRVRDARGQLPGMPSYLSLGSVSEDTGDHLSFWQDFTDPQRGKQMDIRYIYLNGGPEQGWDTWGQGTGSRATNYIRNSKQLGMIPFFVFYNIPDGSEGYELDLAHAQSVTYMKAYFQNLKLALDIINQESPDDTTGIILEPDFLGYLAQNAKDKPSQISAATAAAYESGILKAGEDPAFPDTIKGLVQAINFTISKYAPQVVFGWQLNLWASPAGGWTTPVPVRGLIHKTDTAGIPTGREQIYREAAAITQYYLDAGIIGNGAKFLSIDKYGLDATGSESSAASDPASSIWFWNNDHWLNYLAFVRAMRDTAKLPVILWQLPVGHINSSLEANPYAASGLFPDLTGVHQRYEDSAPTFFLGDTFSAAGARLRFFSENASQDPGLVVSGDRVRWSSHMQQAADAGVISVLFGAGVGASTSGVGSPPTDSYWWIHKAQQYLASPVPLP